MPQTVTAFLHRRAGPPGTLLKVRVRFVTRPQAGVIFGHPGKFDLALSQGPVEKAKGPLADPNFDEGPCVRMSGTQSVSTKPVQIQVPHWQVGLPPGQNCPLRGRRAGLGAPTSGSCAHQAATCIIRLLP